MAKTLFLFLLLFSLNTHAEYKTVTKDTVMMGSAFNFTAVHQDKTQAQLAVDMAIKEVERIERLISSWIKSSETTLINNNAGVQPVTVSKELFDLISRCIKISELSNGYFDITFASLVKIWTFDKRHMTAPSDSLIVQSVAKINYKNIILNTEKSTVFLKEEGMRIGFGAIGKGYAANKAKEVMLSLGIKNGVVNAGGDLTAWGTRPNGQIWKVGIADPEKKTNVTSWVEAKDISVVTSGDYEKYVIIDSIRYGHIVNPKTGWPVRGLKSVTIITQDAEIADALATTVFILGKKDGLALINKLKGVECMIITDENELLFSDNATQQLKK